MRAALAQSQQDGQNLHTIWGSPELEGSSSFSSENPSCERSHDSVKENRMKQIQEIANDVHFECESGSVNESSENNSEKDMLKDDDGQVGITGVFSRGSEFHKQGQCRPCHYFSTKLGCANGQDCEFCHLDHPKRSRPRPCKAKRSQCKRIAGMLDSAFAHDPEQFTQAMELLSSQSGYMKTVMKSKMRNQEKRVLFASEHCLGDGDRQAAKTSGQFAPIEQQQQEDPFEKRPTDAKQIEELKKALSRKMSL